MKSSMFVMVAAALIEIGLASYYLVAEPQAGVLLVVLAVHAVAACLCALVGAAVTAPDIDSKAEVSTPRSRAASFVFYVIPALLLPIGGVFTVVAMSLILRSPAKATSQDAFPFECLSLESVTGHPGSMMAEPLVGALKQLPLSDVRAMATGLRNVRPARDAAVVLQCLQRDEDTEVRFRAQGSVTRAMRVSEDCLKQLAGTETLAPPQKFAAADASLELAEWTPATGANRNTLLESAIGYLSEEGDTPTIPRLSRLVRAQLATRRTEDAMDSLEKLRVAGASEDLLYPLESELLFQQREWNALALRSAEQLTHHPNERFWRAAATAE